MAQVWNIWIAGYKPSDDVGSDSFAMATPEGSLLRICDSTVCSELERQHPDSQVAVGIVKFFEVYSSTIGWVEGDEWRTHGRVITSGLNSAANAAVWKRTTE